MIRVVGVLKNLVPYHHARWEAFAALSGVEAQITEITNRDEFPVLEQNPVAASYGRVTLFREHPAPAKPKIRNAVAKMLQKIQPNVICISGYSMPASLAALDWAHRQGIPSVILSETTKWDRTRAPMREFVKRQIIGMCTSALVGGSPHAEYLVQLGMQRDRLFLGYDAVDNDYFAAGAMEARSRASEIQRRFNLPERFFLASARFTKKKNLLRLVEAYARFRLIASESAGHPKESVIWKLLILGDGPLRPVIEKSINELGLKDHVFLVGAKPYRELPIYYGLASAFVHTSTTEQWGLVVNEAMASGLPVLISNRCGCAVDLVHDGVNGFTFDPWDMEQLSGLMARISRMDTLTRERMGAESARIISEWGPGRFATGLNAATQKALEVGPVWPTLLQRIILKALLWK